MKYVFYFLIIILIGCTSKGAKEIKEKELLNIDTLQENTVDFSFEEEERKMQECMEKERKEFKVEMEKKSFNFACYDKCEDGVGVGVEELRKFGRRKPFDIKKEFVRDSLSLKFKFISDCCLEYIASVEHCMDTLKLSYRNISYTPCDCHCYYYYQFLMPLSKYNFDYIKLGDSLLSPQSGK